MAEQILPPLTCSRCGKPFDGTASQRYEAKNGRRVYCPRCHGTRLTKTPIERFFSHADQNGPVPAKHPELGPCWLSDYHRDDDGYTRMPFGKKSVLTHRWAYENFREPIPPDLELHHLCENPPCCNPYHMMAVTHEENVRLGNAAALKLARTACKRGHERTSENTRYFKGKNGRLWRQCRVCARIDALARYHRKKERLSNPG